MSQKALRKLIMWAAAAALLSNSNMLGQYACKHSCTIAGANGWIVGEAFAIDEDTKNLKVPESASNGWLERSSYKDCCYGVCENGRCL